MSSDKGEILGDPGAEVLAFLRAGDVPALLWLRRGGWNQNAAADLLRGGCPHTRQWSPVPTALR